MNFIRHKKGSADAVVLTEIVLSLYECMADAMQGLRYRNSTKRIEDAFLVAAGHMAYTIAARRAEIKNVPVQRVIEDLTAAIEINAMELHVTIMRETHGQKP